jgi:TolB-like protein
MNTEMPRSEAPAAGLETEGAVPTADPALEERKLFKKRNKVRSAWISFVGRIVAQFVGASASIILGMALLQKYQTAHANPGDQPPAVTPVAQHPRAAVRERAVSGQLALAVLPLEAFSLEPRQKHMAAAMTDALITAMAQVEGLRVISRTSSMLYQSGSKPLPDIGRELGVDLILEGSLVRSRDRVRVTAQLIDARTDEHVWARSYDRPLSEALALQDAMTSAIVRDVMAAMSRRDGEPQAGGAIVSGMRYGPPRNQ